MNFGERLSLIFQFSNYDFRPGGQPRKVYFQQPQLPVKKCNQFRITQRFQRSTAVVLVHPSSSNYSQQQFQVRLWKKKKENHSWSRLLEESKNGRMLVYRQMEWLHLHKLPLLRRCRVGNEMTIVSAYQLVQAIGLSRWTGKPYTKGLCQKTSIYAAAQRTFCQSFTGISFLFKWYSDIQL